MSEVNDKNTPETSGQEGKNQEEVLKYTEKDLEKAVNSRLTRERNKFSDYDDLKKQVSEYEALKTKVGEYQAKITKMDDLEATLKTAFDDMLDQIPEDKRSLIPDGLSLKDKISYIRTNRSHLIDNKSLSSKAPNVPEVPKTETVSKGAGQFGGYSSYIEWQMKDPKGYEKANRGW